MFSIPPATCGYLYAIITPAVLWSDVVHLKDGHFWNSSYPIDSTKLFFRVMFVLFCLNELTSIVGSIIFQRPSDTNAYTGQCYSISYDYDVICYYILFNAVPLLFRN